LDTVRFRGSCVFREFRTFAPFLTDCGHYIILHFLHDAYELSGPWDTGQIFIKLGTTALREELRCNLSVHAYRPCLTITSHEDLKFIAE
jgi:hypothetical protein